MKQKSARVRYSGFVLPLLAALAWPWPVWACPAGDVGLITAAMAAAREDDASFKWDVSGTTAIDWAADCVNCFDVSCDDCTTTAVLHLRVPYEHRAHEMRPCPYSHPSGRVTLEFSTVPEHVLGEETDDSVMTGTMSAGLKWHAVFRCPAGHLFTNPDEVKP